MSAINENDYMNNQLFKITLATGEDFKVFAYDEEEAIDLLIKHLIEDEREYACYDYYTIADLCEVGESVGEYITENNFYGNGNGVYIKIEEIKIIKEEF